MVQLEGPSQCRRESSEDRYFALPCAAYEALARRDLRSTDKKLLFSVIWFTLGWRQATKTVSLKKLRTFSNVSEKSLYESRKRLVASKDDTRSAG